MVEHAVFLFLGEVTSASVHQAIPDIFVKFVSLWVPVPLTLSLLLSFSPLLSLSLSLSLSSYLPPLSPRLSLSVCSRATRIHILQ